MDLGDTNGEDLLARGSMPPHNPITAGAANVTPRRIKRGERETLPRLVQPSVCVPVAAEHPTRAGMRAAPPF